MIKAVVAVLRTRNLPPDPVKIDGSEVVSSKLTIFQVPDKEFDLIKALRMAVTDWCVTGGGLEYYFSECNSFNWGDIEELPTQYCEKFGFERLDIGKFIQDNHKDVETITVFDTIFVDWFDELTNLKAIMRLQENIIDDTGEYRQSTTEDLEEVDVWLE